MSPCNKPAYALAQPKKAAYGRPRYVSFVAKSKSTHTPDFDARDSKLLVDAMLAVRDDRKLNQSRFAECIGVTQPAISQVESGANGIKLSTANALAKFLRYENAQHLLDELREGRSPLRGPDSYRRAAFTMSIGTLQMKLDRLPGLRAWVESDPSRITVAEIARGVAAYDAMRPRSREDGVPLGGWESYFADVKAGRLEEAPIDDDAAENLERKQLPKASRKLLGR